jgi:aspartate 1-decarboxylase
MAAFIVTRVFQVNGRLKKLVSSHMQIHLLKSKIHRAEVTAANVNYEGSLTIAEDFMEKTGILPYERILCGNMANGQRFETYAIPGQRGSGAIILNGGVAHLGKVGDRLTIMSYAVVDHEKAAKWQPRIIVLGENNKILSERGI